MWRYAPDLDPTTPEIITSISGALIPTARGGYRAGFSYVEKWYNGTTPPSGYNGAAVCTSDAGASRLFLGANTSTPDGRLYELTGTGTRTDRSRGGNYTWGAFFTFAQLGGVTVAGNKSDALQSSTTGAFADVSGAPKARIVLAEGNQIVLLNYDDGTNTPDGWATSDVGTTSSWTVDEGNEARRGRLRDSGGDIVAGCVSPFGGVIAFKRNSCYLGRYAGLPKVREWSLISPRYGCRWIEGCINTGTRVYFAGDDIFEFDGSQIRSITDGVRKHIYETALATAARVVLQYDEVNKLLYVWYGDTAQDVFDGCFVYNTVTGLWGDASGYAEWWQLINGSSAAASLIAAITATRDELTNIFGTSGAFGTSLVVANQPCFLTSSGSIVSFGNMGAEYPPPSAIGAGPFAIAWTCSWMGGYEKASTIRMVTPRVTTTNDEAVDTAGNFTGLISSRQFTPHGAITSSVNLAMDANYRFPTQASGHWHQISYAYSLVNVTPTKAFEWFGHHIDGAGAGKT